MWRQKGSELHHWGEFLHDHYTFESVHDSNHDGVVRIFVGLSCELRGFFNYITLDYILWRNYIMGLRSCPVLPTTVLDLLWNPVSYWNSTVSSWQNLCVYPLMYPSVGVLSRFVFCWSPLLIASIAVVMSHMWWCAHWTNNNDADKRYSVCE